MVGRVGTDENGRLLRSSLDAAGVDTSALLADASVPTGTAFIAIDATGQNEIVIVAGANGRVGMDDVERNRSLIEGAAFLLLQLEVPLAAVEAAARVARAAGHLSSIRPPPRPRLFAAALVDYASPAAGSRATADEVEGHAGRRLIERGARRVVVKLGPLGAMLVTRTVRRQAELAVRWTRPRPASQAGARRPVRRREDGREPSPTWRPGSR
jgi:ribokinase